ncbi:secreted phosphoprotein 24 isoform X1 [Otolemur garnettii]|uniref:secreted phosphoprotein 24 isoform X1 n=1 Tax=Otolemur garnettii TaxID=30611 RepID=UPI000644234B|nr:secreted phosphoprotein 24 isoform X1 [Otolemur garnettii]
MEKMAMKMLIVFALGMHDWWCSGFPVYDYDPSTLREALRASVAKVNSQSLSPYLFRPFRSSLKRVEALDENNLVMSLEFSVRETTCRKDSGEDPSTCAFQRSYSVMIFGTMLGSHIWRNNDLFGLISDESRSGQFYDRSLEILRRAFPPGNRRYPNYRHRARIAAGLE